MGGECTNDENKYLNYEQVRCADPHTNWFVVILLALYVLVTNLLLFNLLIAIFTTTYEKILGSFILMKMLVEWGERPIQSSL